MESNEDLDVWTLKLREGVKWADGEAFNADDVIFTIQMLKDNAPELGYSGVMQEWVESVEKVDDLTVQFNLTKPNPRWQLDYFSVKIWGAVVIVPEHVWKDQDPLTFTFYDPDKGWPFGTGPYLPVSVSETLFIYERDDNWWGVEAGFKDRLPYPEKLIWTWAATEDTRAAMMANDELDSLMDVTLGAFEAIRAQNPNIVAWYDELPFAWPDPCPRQFSVNHEVEPWGDPDMRWALNYAISREQIVNIAYEGTTVPNYSMFVGYPPLNALVDKLREAGLYEKYPIDKYDPELAAEIIESKGYTKNADGYYEKDGEVLSLNISVYEGLVELTRPAQIIVENLQQLGIDASVRALTGSTWGDNYAFGEFEAVTDWHACGSINEPWNSMDQYTANYYEPVGERAPNNEVRWSGPGNERYTELVDQMGVLPLGDPAIEPLFMEAMEIWMRELPFIPMTQARKLVPFNATYWTGWPTKENNYNHPATWWFSTHQIIHNLEPAQ
jgi:peptide/nickel transport system substrate-binding protein